MNRGTNLREFGYYRGKAQQMGLRRLARLAARRIIKDPARRLLRSCRLKQLPYSHIVMNHRQMSLESLRVRTLGFVETMQSSLEPLGCYVYSKEHRTSVLYASVYSALTRHLHGDLDSLTADEKARWADYINSFKANSREAGISSSRYPAERADRQVRALRLLPSDVPHLRAVGRGNGLAARTHLPDEGGRRGPGGDDGLIRPSFRPLPRMPRVRDRLSLRR